MDLKHHNLISRTFLHFKGAALPPVCKYALNSTIVQLKHLFKSVFHGLCTKLCALHIAAQPTCYGIVHVCSQFYFSFSPPSMHFAQNHAHCNKKATSRYFLMNGGCFHDLLVCGFATSTLIAFRASVPSSREPLIASPSFLSSSSLSSFPLLFLLFPFSYFSVSPSFHLLFLSPLSISPSFPRLTTTLLNFLTFVGMSTVGSYCKLTWVE